MGVQIDTTGLGNYESTAAWAESANAASDAAAAASSTAGATASAASTPSQELLSVLPDLLPNALSAEGHLVTPDTVAAKKLIDFLKAIPGAEGLASAVESGKVSDEDYSKISQVLSEQAGVPATGTSETQTAATPEPAASSATTDAAMQASSDAASAILADQDNIIQRTTEPAKDGYRFAFDGQEGQVFKTYLERVRVGLVEGETGITGDRGVDAGQEISAELYDKAMRGEMLTQDEYKQVWSAIGWQALSKSRDDASYQKDVADQVGHEYVLEGDQSTGYLWAEGDDTLHWVGADGADRAIFDRSSMDNTPLGIPGFTQYGTKEQFLGVYTVPPEKRDMVVKFLEGLPDTEGKQSLIDAVKSGSLSGEQYIDLTERLDVAKNFGVSSAVSGDWDSFLANFSAA